MSMIDTWGTTAEERRRPYPCDELAGEPSRPLYRGVSVAARPATVFRWLCQLRAAPYSYDALDNFGLTSPRTLTPGLDRLAVGQSVMTIFRVVSFEPDVHITLKLAWPLSGKSPAFLSYVVTPDGAGCRLTCKIVARSPTTRAGKAIFQGIAWADLVMMRKQLLTFKELAEKQEQVARSGGPASA